MSDGGRLPAIAIGMAITAVVLAGISVIVVATRSAPTAEAEAEVSVGSPVRTIDVRDVVELEHGGVEPASDRTQMIGVKVVDPSLRNMLGLGADDVITAISGRAIRRQLDIHDALMGASMMNATALFVELMRGGEPVLVRWDLDGNLREARRTPSDRRGGGVFGGPSARPVRDPLVDTITQIDDHHVTVPRATIEQLAASPATYAQGARVLPAYKLGRSEGVRLYLVRPTSALWSLGLRSADMIKAVNGVAITDPARLVDLYEQVKSATTLRIEIDRRGSLEVIEIMQTP